MSAERVAGPACGTRANLQRLALPGPRLPAHVLRCAARHVGCGAPHVSRVRDSGGMSVHAEGDSRVGLGGLPSEPLPLAVTGRWTRGGLIR